MQNDAHLLFPLLSSVLFVVGALFAKLAMARGANFRTAATLSNLCIAVCWALVAVLRDDGLPANQWWMAAWVAAVFVGGQLLTYLTFHVGDVSLATPILGTKIILVAVFVSVLAGEAIPRRIWLAAFLATAGVAVIQWPGGRKEARDAATRRTGLTIALSLLSALALSVFDVSVQAYGRELGASRYLPAMFVTVGVFSCGLLPWCDRPATLRRTAAAGPLMIAGLLIAAQAVSITYSLAQFGDATRVNIVYSLRGLWSVALAWLLTRFAWSPEAATSDRVFRLRLTGALLLTAAVILALA